MLGEVTYVKRRDLDVDVSKLTVHITEIVSSIKSSMGSDITQGLDKLTERNEVDVTRELTTKVIVVEKHVTNSIDCIYYKPNVTKIVDNEKIVVSCEQIINNVNFHDEVEH